MAYDAYCTKVTEQDDYNNINNHADNDDHTPPPPPPPHTLCAIVQFILRRGNEGFTPRSHNGKEDIKAIETLAEIAAMSGRKDILEAMGDIPQDFEYLMSNGPNNTEPTENMSTEEVDNIKELLYNTMETLHQDVPNVLLEKLASSVLGETQETI